MFIKCLFGKPTVNNDVKNPYKLKKVQFII